MCVAEVNHPNQMNAKDIFEEKRGKKVKSSMSSERAKIIIKGIWITVNQCNKKN
jgi:hypothetical protein